jgi:hypothetical protein
VQRLSELKSQLAQAQREQARVATPEQKEQVLALARDFPRLWYAPTTEAKDRKRMLRLLIKDITVEKRAPKQLVLHIRWQGGACSDAQVDLPPNIADRIRYPNELVERIRALAETLTDTQVAEQLNQEGRVSPKGKAFTASMIQWVRYKHKIAAPQLKNPGEWTVEQVMEKFGVSRHVVYYWIERGHLEARQLKPGTPYWISLDNDKEQMLTEWVRSSSRMPARQNTEATL